MKLKNKKALSTVIMTVLLILLAVVVASIIFFSSKSFLSDVQKDSAIKMAEEQCGSKFNVQLAACYKINHPASPPPQGPQDTIYLDLINLKETIPAGSSILLDNGFSKFTIPLDGINPLSTLSLSITQGEGKSLEVSIYQDKLKLSEYFNPNGKNTLKFVPVFTYNEERVLCNEIPEIDIKPCP